MQTTAESRVDATTPDASTTVDGTALDGSTLAWTSVCTLDQLEPLWGEAALVNGDQVALFLLPDGSLYAVTNRDPATGSCVMSRGIVGSKGDRHTIASPLHKQVYDLATGECFTTPDYSLRTFPVRVDGGVVMVSVETAETNFESSAAA